MFLGIVKNAQMAKNAQKCVRCAIPEFGYGASQRSALRHTFLVAPYVGTPAW